MNGWRAHGKLIGCVAAAGLCAAAVFCGHIEENMRALVPQRIKRAVELFEQSPLSQKLIVVVQAPDAAQAARISHALRDDLLAAQLITPPPAAAEALVPQLLSGLPARFSAAAEQETQQKIAPAAVAQRLDTVYAQLFSFESVFAAQQLARDPFDLTSVLLRPWAALLQTNRRSYGEGLISSADGTVQAGLYDASHAVSDLSAAQRLQQFFAQQQAALPPGTRSFFMGGLRYTLENATVIKRDLAFLSLAGFAALGGIFLWLFRSRRALLIYALPLLVLPPAAWAAQLVFGSISGITLGFGSVVAGLSVDYAIYVYFSLRGAAGGTAAPFDEIRKHLGCTFLTSALCFAALFFSSVEVFKQIAVFALAALSLACWIAWRVFPPYFSGHAAKQEVPFTAWHIKPLPFGAAMWISVGLLIFGAWGAQRVVFSPGLQALNSTSAAFARDKQLTDELFDADQNALLFALGRTREEALWRNEELAARLPQGLPMSELFVSPQIHAHNEARWRAFWTDARVQQAREVLSREAQKKGFKAPSFTPFWEWLAQSTSAARDAAQTEPNGGTQVAQTVDFSSWYNPVLRLTDGSYAVVNVVPNGADYAAAANGETAVFVAARQLQNELAQGVKQEALRVVLWALLLNLLAVWAVFRNLKEALLCFVPVVLGGCVLFGVLGLTGVEVNLFALIFLPLLIGLGIDYAIFQRMKYRAASEGAAEGLYPPQALVAAGLSTLAGFGVLVLAQHTVLRMMGLCALLGIGGAVVCAVWILPSCWERYS